MACLQEDEGAREEADVSYLGSPGSPVAHPWIRSLIEQAQFLLQSLRGRGYTLLNRHPPTEEEEDSDGEEEDSDSESDKSDKESAKLLDYSPCPPLPNPHTDSPSSVYRQTQPSVSSTAADHISKRVPLAKYLLKHTWKSVKRSKVNFCIGLSACFLVVVVVAVLVSVLQTTPIVFLRLSELLAGEVDCRIKVRGSLAEDYSLNYTEIQQLVSGLSYDNVPNAFTYISPRLTGSVDLFTSLPSLSRSATRENHGHASVPSGSLSYNATTSSIDRSLYSSPSSFRRTVAPSTRAFLYAIDTEKEKKMGLGRMWEFSPLHKGEIYIPSKLADKIGFTTGDTLYLPFYGADIAPGFWRNLFSPYVSETGEDINPQSSNAGTNGTLAAFRSHDILLPLRIKDTFSNPRGKYPSTSSTGVFLEFSQLIPALLDSLQANLTTLPADIIPVVLARLRTLTLYDTVPEIEVAIPPSVRAQYYLHSDYDSIQREVTKFFATLNYQLGFQVTSIALPVLRNLQLFSIVNMFLELIFSVIIFVLLLICVILQYSLLSAQVETRTFEFGALRMQGMNRKQLTVLILYQSLAYAIPSYVPGLIVAQILGFFLSDAFISLTGVEVTPWLNGSAVGLAALFGVGMPVLASVAPITAALGRQLGEALDERQSQGKAVVIDIERSETAGLSPAPLIAGGMLSFFGVAIYYLLPYALISWHLSLLLYLFVGFLIGMLLGLALLSLNLQHFMETFFTHFLLFWDNPGMRALVSKNLVAHRIRNRKTTMLYAVSLSFIVFVSVSWSLEEKSILYGQMAEGGSLIKVQAPTGGDDPPTYLPRIPPQYYQALETFAEKSPAITHFAWISQSAHLFPYFRGLKLTNTGHVYSAPISLYGVSPGVFGALLSRFLKIDSVVNNEDGPIALGTGLYTLHGSSSVITGSLYKESVGLKLDEPFLIVTSLAGDYFLDKEARDPHQNQPGLNDDVDPDAQLPSDTYTVMHPLRPRAFLHMSPHFRFSRYPNVVDQDVVVSLPAFLRLTEDELSGIEDIPMKAFVFSLRDDVTEEEENLIVKQLDSILAGQADVYDYRNHVETLQQASDLISYFFNFTTVVAMLVCFFSLNSAMFTNIYQQTKEISIMRAVGLGRSWLYRLYIFEAMILVFSSSFIGIGIGTLVGYTMSIQRELFTQLPIPFILPWGIVAVVSICSLLFAFGASFAPISRLMKKSIVSTMRSAS